jgi:hypothetical protein
LQLIKQIWLMLMIPCWYRLNVSLLN